MTLAGMLGSTVALGIVGTVLAGIGFGASALAQVLQVQLPAYRAQQLR